MKTQKLMVLLLLVACISLIANVSALENYVITGVTVDGVSVNSNPSVVAGEIVTIKVWFEALSNDTDVTVEVELNGQKVRVNAITPIFDVEAGKTYRKVLDIQVPYELKDQVSDQIRLTVEIDGRKFRDRYEYSSNVQRPSYNAEVMSVNVPSKIGVGSQLPVDLVIKNRGYNRLEDLYVTVKIPALGLETSTYVGDLYALERDCEDSCNQKDDTISGRLYLSVPYGVKSGVYALEVKVENDDTVTREVKQIVIENALPNTVIATSYSRTAAVGETAEYSLLLVNPTNTIKVFRVVTESTSDLSTSTSESVIAVSAGSSREIAVRAKANNEGEYAFNVNIFSNDQLVEVTTLNLVAEGKMAINPTVILTIILAIVFIVLLVVLIVLLSKKPEKTDDFGESYY